MYNWDLFIFLPASIAYNIDAIDLATSFHESYLTHCYSTIK